MVKSTITASSATITANASSGERTMKKAGENHQLRISAPTHSRISGRVGVDGPVAPAGDGEGDGQHDPQRAGYRLRQHEVGRPQPGHVVARSGDEPDQQPMPITTAMKSSNRGQPCRSETEGMCPNRRAKPAAIWRFQAARRITMQ